MKKLKIFTVIGLVSMIAAIGFSSCKEENDLVAPSGFQVDQDNLLTWSDVDGAKNYQIEIKNLETGKIETGAPKKESFSLDELDRGYYEIRIKAIGGEDGVESDWSETYEFYRATNCLYKEINNSEYQIVSKGGATGVVVIEDTYRGKPVTSIADLAFRKCWGMTELILGENVRSIGESAFLHCKELTKVTLSESLTYMGEAAFQDCLSLTEITIPEGLTEISNYAFAYCKSLTTVGIHDKLTKIGEAAFLECRELATFTTEDLTAEGVEAEKAVTIPDSVTEIGAQAFDSLSAMEKLSIGSGLKVINENTFANCSSLEELEFSDKSSLETIAQRAFSAPVKLTSLTLPKGLIDIGYAAFYDATELAEIDLPDTLMHLSAFSFTGSKVYKEQWTNPDSNGFVFVYIDDWLYACNNGVKGIDSEGNWSKDDEVVGLTDIWTDTLKAGTVGIADEAFYGAQDLQRAELPKTIRAIGQYAFYKCPVLSKAHCNETVLVDDYAFALSQSLTDLDLGSKLERIGKYAFESCTGVVNNANKSIIPETVEQIGTHAFRYTGIWDEGGKAADGVVYAGNWVVGYNGQPGAVTLQPGTVGIADWAFYKCSTLQSVSGLMNVEHLGRAAFYECPKLTTATLGSKLEKVEEYTFYKCSNLSTITFAYSVNIDTMERLGVKEIGKSAFYKCEWLSAVDFSRSEVEKVDDFAFYGCTGLETIEFGEKLNHIGENAFYQCGALTELVLPNTLTKIENRAFYNCDNLKTVSFNKESAGTGLETIGKFAFSNCDMLTEVEFPESLKTIEKSAFYQSYSLEKANFGANLETIGDYAFANAKSLFEVYLPANVTVGKYAFMGCSALSSLTLSKDVKTISDHAFYGCKQMTVYTDATDTKSAGWSDKWNSSHRPVVWGVELSADGKQVVSITVTENTFSNVNVKTTVSAAEKGAERVVGWSTSENGSVVYLPDQIGNAPIGTKLYPVWGTFTPVVTFKYNYEFSDYEGYELVKSAEVAYGGSYAATELQAPENSGYGFCGYYLDSTFTKELTVEEFAAKKIYRDIVVYVKWYTPEEMEEIKKEEEENGSVLPSEEE